MLNEVAYSPDIVWITYGWNRFDPKKFQPINYSDPSIEWTNKPFGGLWACPINSKCGWRQWCEFERFRLKGLKKHFTFKIKPEAKIYVIDNEADLVKISTTPCSRWGDNRDVLRIDYERLLREGYDGLYVTENATYLRLRALGMYGPDNNVMGLDAWDVESICVFNPDIITPLEKENPLAEGKGKRRKVIITESQLNAIVDEERFNVKNVYHVSGDVFDRFEKKNFDYFFFSNKPIDINGSKVVYTCNLSMHKPFIFTEGTSWSYPLWLFLSDKEGYLIPEEDFTPEKYEGYLGCPYEFWKKVYYDQDEYSMDEIPRLVQELNMGYDGVIIEGIQEGDTGLMVNDYIVFSPEQIQIVRKSIR